MSDICERNFGEVMDLANRLIEITGDGQADCKHDNCYMVYGTIFDCASRIRLEVEKWLKENR